MFFSSAELEKSQILVARDLDAVLTLRPGLREEPRKLRELAELLDAQRVELEWYADFPRYETDADVLEDRGLTNLVSARREGKLRFDFQVLREDPLSRGLRLLRRISSRGIRFLTGSTRRPLSETTAGMRMTRCKPAMVAFLNEFSLRVVDLARRPGFRPRVNSILRTLEHQLHLIHLGYPAPADSTHCVGYAADLEKNWYQREQPAAHGAMAEVLEDYRRNGVLNVIDESNVWHICLHPDRINHYARLAETESR